MASLTFGEVLVVSGDQPTSILLRGQRLDKPPRLRPPFACLSGSYAAGDQVAVILPVYPNDLVNDPLIIGPLTGITESES